jgi:hypothetical protein
MTADVNEIRTLEDARFTALQNERNVRMTVDWLDFSVEGPSKWWKLLDALGAENDPIPHDATLSKLQALLKNFRVPVDEETHMKATLAVIAFQPCKISSQKPERGRTLTVTVLAGTTASLIQSRVWARGRCGMQSGGPRNFLSRPSSSSAMGPSGLALAMKALFNDQS